MAWLFVPGLVAESSPCASRWATPIAVSSTSSAKLTPQPASWRGWRTRPWIQLLSGTMSEPSEADRGVARWISSLRASRASHTAAPASGGTPPTSAGSGRTSLGSFARLSPDGSSWRTCLPLFGADSTSFSGIWPYAGSMRSGTCFRQRKSARRTFANASLYWPTPKRDAASWWPTPMACATPRINRSPSHGARERPTLALAATLWPTPTVGDSDRASLTFGHGEGNPTLVGAAMLWPTPTRMDAAMSGGSMWPARGKSHSGTTLTDAAVRLWSTPTVNDSKHLGNPSQWRRNHGRGALNVQDLDVQRSLSSRLDAPTSAPGGRFSRSSRALNPRFVEWLMGWPDGMTDCGLPVRGWSRWLQQSRFFAFALASRE